MPVNTLGGTFVWGQVSYPGIFSLESFTYTMSHGISPGCAVITFHPQDTPPDQDGDLIVSDGLETIVLPGCRCDAVKVERDDNGFFFRAEIVDRRWRWRELGAISGCFNQYDPFGKLIPFTIRSPKELAALCLDAMGETNYVLNLPPGIDFPGLFLGSDIRNISGVNPPINWYWMPPAQALQQVAELFGCRVIYQASTDSIYVGPIGIGPDLPDGSIQTQGVALKNPETPDSIGVVGAPTRFQVLMWLQAVGEEWDGSYRPIDQLSYAPVVNPQPQIVFVVPKGMSVNNDWDVIINGIRFKGLFTAGAGGTIATCTALAAAINGDKLISGWVTAAVTLIFAGEIGVTITSIVPGINGAFTISLEVPAAAAVLPTGDFTVQITQIAKDGGRSWAGCMPPLFPGGPTNPEDIKSPPLPGGIIQTTRLSYEDARRLAQKSVFKVYRVVPIDTSVNWRTKNFAAKAGDMLFVPGYGRITHIQQIVLQETQVDQVVPQPGDSTIQGVEGRPITVNFYNGYSRDKPAVVFGSISNTSSPGIWYKLPPGSPIDPNGPPTNTPKNSQVFVPFSIDPLRYQITFSNYVYHADFGGYVSEPKLVLQTAIMVRDPLNNQLQGMWKIIPLPGQDSQTLPRIYHHDDVQANVTTSYAPNDSVNGFGIVTETKYKLTAWSLFEADPLLRINYYLASHLKEYLLSGANIIHYNGIKAIDLSGTIQQVTWNIDGSGVTTVASYNCEHSTYIYPYPARLRAEFLDPVRRVEPQRVDMPTARGPRTADSRA